MKSLNVNRGLKPNSLNNDETCRASVENKKLALLEDQVDKLQIDLGILAKEVKDFGSSFNTASAYITKLEANNATIKETLTAKNLISENTSTKTIIKQFQQKNASASCIVGQSVKKEADLDIVVIKNGIPQYVKLHLNGTTVISQGAGADYITDFRVYENGTAEVLFSDTADIMVYSESSDFTAFKGTTSGPYKTIPVHNEITLSGKLNIDNEEVISFNNVDIKSLTVNELTSLDLINAVRLSATELHVDAATILDATIEVLKAQQIDTTELHATNGVVDTLNVTNLNVDATCSAGNINSSGTIKAEAFEALKGIRAEDIKMDKKLQLPVITNTDYTDIEMPVKSGMVFGMIIDEATKECLASFTLIKNTTKFSNVLFCYSQKELHNILSVHEDEDKDFILRTKLSGKTLVYGLVSNEDMLTFEAVVNSARPMKINHDITYLQHTLIMGDKSLAFGLEIDGELRAALIPLPGTSAFDDIVISNTLAVGKEVNFGTETLDAVFNMYGISTFNGAVNIDGKTTIGGTTAIGGNTSIGTVDAPADLTVTGNIYQKGDAYETHVQQLKTTKDWIITRQPEDPQDPTPPLAPGEMSGIKAVAYDDEGNNGILGFDKTGTARVGDEGKEQAIATRAEEAEMVNGNIVAWNGTDKKLVTPKVAIVDGHILASKSAVDDEVKARADADTAIINGTTPVQKVAPNANTWDFYGGTQLPAKVDMKTIITPGTYCNILDRPENNPIDVPSGMKGAGVLKVYISLGGVAPNSYITQEWTDYRNPNNIARRLTENKGKTWTDWQIFEGVGLNDKMATQNWVQDEATAFGAKYLVDRGSINSAFTPNEAIEDGIYYRWGGNGTANMPYGLDSAGILMTKAIHSNKDFIAQIYFELSSRAMFLRSKYTGKWQDWLMIDNLSSGILIKDNSNLNDYINPGIYVSPRSDNHIKNNPVKGYGAGRLRVYQSVGNHSYITQKWEKLGGSSIYTRYCTFPDSIWSHWYKFEGVNMGV